MLALDLLVVMIVSWECRRRSLGRITYGAGCGTLKGLLALDGDVGAIGSLELNVKGGCTRK
jgi:hypothetical protein